jgi:hypothetical protein
VFTASLHSNERGAARYGKEETPLSLLLPLFVSWKWHNLSQYLFIHLLINFNALE